jgi:hypothetical protein
MPKFHSCRSSSLSRECCLLVLNLVSSTLPCIRRPRLPLPLSLSLPLPLSLAPSLFCPRFEACRSLPAAGVHGRGGMQGVLYWLFIYFILCLLLYGIIEYKLLLHPPPPPRTHTHTHRSGGSGRTTFMMRTARSTLWACGSLLRTPLPLQTRR